MIKKMDWYNTKRYQVTDIETGDTDNLSNHMAPPAGKGWNQTFPREISRILEMVGGAPAVFLGYLLTHKNTDNQVIGSATTLGGKAGVSKSTSERTMKTLQQEDLIRKVQNGIYMVNPTLLSWGGAAHQRLQKDWEKLS